MAKRRNKNKAGPVKVYRPTAEVASVVVDVPEEQPATQVPDAEMPIEQLSVAEMSAPGMATAEIVAAEMPVAQTDMSIEEPQDMQDMQEQDNPAMPALMKPASAMDEVEDASAALAQAIDVDPSTITSKPAQIESIAIIEPQDTAIEMGDQDADPNATITWGSVGTAADSARLTFDIPEHVDAESVVAEDHGKKGKKPDRRLKLNKLQKHARSVPSVEPEAVPEPEPAPPRAPREPRIAAFAKLTEYQQLSLAHVPGLPAEADVPGHWRGVGFGISGRRLVSAFDEVVEIIRMPQITHVPGTQSWMLGVANVRGTLLPVVDLKQFLEGERTVIHEGQRVLVVRQAGGNVAVLIDQLYGQRSFNDAQKTAVAEDESRYGYFVKQMYRVGDNDWGVFSMSMLTRTPEFRQAAA